MRCCGSRCQDVLHVRHSHEIITLPAHAAFAYTATRTHIHVNAFSQDARCTAWLGSRRIYFHILLLHSSRHRFRSPPTHRCLFHAHHNYHLHRRSLQRLLIFSLTSALLLPTLRFVFVVRLWLFACYRFVFVVAVVVIFIASACVHH